MDTDVFEHFNSSISTCVVAFASNAVDLYGDIPPFEFGHTLKSMEVDYVLFRDSTGYICQYGIVGIGPRERVVEYLVDLSKRYYRLVITGVSNGAMASCLYSQLMAISGADVSNVEVVSISPVSYRDPDAVFGIDWRTRGPWDILEMDLLNDLAVIFPNGPLVRTRAFYTDRDHADILDRNSALRIGINDLTLIPGATHSSLGRFMRDQGVLQRVLKGERV